MPSAAQPCPRAGRHARRVTLKLFHERMGHVNYKDCMRLAEQHGVKLTNTASYVCDVCRSELAKLPKTPITDLASRAAQPL